MRDWRHRYVMSRVQGHSGAGIQTYVVSLQGPGSWALPSAAFQSILRIRVATPDCFKESGGYELSFENWKGLGTWRSRKIGAGDRGAKEESTRAKTGLASGEDGVRTNTWGDSWSWIVGRQLAYQTGFCSQSHSQLSWNLDFAACRLKTLSNLLNSEPQFSHF